MIRYEETGHVFTLETAHAAYQMMADGYGYLQHLHFGGKLGGGFVPDANTDKKPAIAAAKAVEGIAAQIEGKTIVKEIYVPGKLVNLVVR